MDDKDLIQQAKNGDTLIIEEVEVDGYTTSIAGKVELGFTVTNTEDFLTLEDPKDEPQEDSKDPVVDNEKIKVMVKNYQILLRKSIV